jgi:hypothetical protein
MASNGYSNIKGYGTDRKDVPIIVPKPVDMVYGPFRFVSPHTYKPNQSWQNLNNGKNPKFTSINVMHPTCTPLSLRREFADDSQRRRENQRLNQGFYAQYYRNLSGF